MLLALATWGSLSMLSSFCLLAYLLKIEEISKLPQAGDKAISTPSIQAESCTGCRRHWGIQGEQGGMGWWPPCCRLYALTRRLQILSVLEHWRRCDFQSRSPGSFLLDNPEKGCSHMSPQHSDLRCFICANRAVLGGLAENRFAAVPQSFSL